MRLPRALRVPSPEERAAEQAAEAAETARRHPSRPCLRCGATLTDWQCFEVRTGGTSGSAKLFFGELAELGEGTIPIEIWVCGQCQTLDLRRPIS